MRKSLSVLALSSLLALGARELPAQPVVQLVESWPVETSLDHPEIPDAPEVWVEMIRGASTHIDLAHFYASNHEGGRLESVILALESAAARGVRIRFLAEKKFENTYPATLARLDVHEGIEVRIYDVAARMGGVLHAKLMLVDGRELFVGSQNFDWRALEHIQELGIRASVPAVVRAFEDVFETDWALADPDTPADHRAPTPPDGYGFPAEVDLGGDPLRLTPVFSPTGWLPDESLWDLPRLVGLMDGAQRTLRVQLLTYRAVGRDGHYFDALESALRRAAARGVKVELLLAHWSKRRGTIEGLQSLQALPNVTVKLMTIPEWSGGFIDYARVVHAKYCVVDGERFWLGTSNWEKSYFHDGRNAGLIVEGEALAREVDAFFVSGWESPYAVQVDACASYTPPRIGE